MQYLGRLICLILLLVPITSRAADNGICGFPVMGSVAIESRVAQVAHFEVTLSQTPERHSQGLMHCPELAPGRGMLFIYPDAQRRSFWMKNTTIELAIVYITDGWRIAAIERGDPGNTASILSPEGIQFVLEINYAEAAPLALGDGVHLQLTDPSSAPALEGQSP